MLDLKCIKHQKPLLPTAKRPRNSRNSPRPVMPWNSLRTSRAKSLRLSGAQMKSLMVTRLKTSLSTWLVVEPPLWKIWKSIGMIIPNIWENTNHVPTHQLVIFQFTLRCNCVSFLSRWHGQVWTNPCWSPFHRWWLDMFWCGQISYCLLTNPEDIISYLL